MAEEVNKDGFGTVLLETSMGNIKIKLYDDMPVTAGNFKKLVEQGFYDGVIFHRVMDGFMIQWGIITECCCRGHIRWLYGRPDI